MRNFFLCLFLSLLTTAAQSQSFCDEFVNAGGKYGVVSEIQRAKNTQVLLKLFKEHNGLTFEEKKRIQN